MEPVERYREFLVNIAEQHPNKSFFESVLTGYNTIFESTVATVETDQADQLSEMLKGSDIPQKEQSAIFTKFIEVDPTKAMPRLTLSMIFSNVKRMLIDLSNGAIKVDDILAYLDQYTN